MEAKKTAQDLLEELAHLSELAGENPFKTRAFKNAAQVVAGRTDLKKIAEEGKLTEIKGVGKGIAEILTEFLLKNKTSEIDRLAKSLPEGLIELSGLPGLGPKKARVLIEKLYVQSLRELEYACREGKVARLEGFGEASQTKILEAIRFKNLNSSKVRLSVALEQSKIIRKRITSELKIKIEETGELRRRCEILSKLDFIVESSAKNQKKLESIAHKALGDMQVGLQFHFTEPKNWGYEWAKTTASDAHWKALGSPKEKPYDSEEDFYGSIKKTYVPAEMRETGEELDLVKKEGLQAFLAMDGVRGVFHNHTIRSDGRATLEEMVGAAEKLGFEYIGISEHSETSFYARGLKLADINAQEKEIREVQKKFPKIKIFWGIESDILKDGDLDYPESVLKRFDFVIASVHQRFKLDKDSMTQRVLTAIRNPYTSILGHLTGRLLLDRAPFELDIEKVIEEASKHGVAIEINANPERLDIDWRWGAKLRECKTDIFINPDAHTVEGLEDTRFGVMMARKAMLLKKQVINSRSAEDVAQWLKS